MSNDKEMMWVKGSFLKPWSAEQQEAYAQRSAHLLCRPSLWFVAAHRVRQDLRELDERAEEGLHSHRSLIMLAVPQLAPTEMPDRIHSCTVLELADQILPMFA